METTYYDDAARTARVEVYRHQDTTTFDYGNGVTHDQPSQHIRIRRYRLGKFIDELRVTGYRLTFIGQGRALVSIPGPRGRTYTTVGTLIIRKGNTR